MRSNLETINATIAEGRNGKAWIYRKEDSGWCIIKTDQGTCKGVIEPAPTVGEVYQLEGFGKISEFDGKKEFIFRAATLVLDEDPRALLHYAVTLTLGLGPTGESAIWDKYGSAWRETRELDIKGISATVKDNWSDTLDRLVHTEEKARVHAWLVSHGCSMKMAAAAWIEWREKTSGKVSRDPFVLATLPNYGFLSVDDGIRQTFDIADDDPRRLRAATLYAANGLARSNGTAIDADMLRETCAKLIPDKLDSFSAIVNELMDLDNLVFLSDQYLALKSDYDDESRIWNRNDPKIACVF